jgi:uncharacterized membrane protein YphA (DoxX/SURF4 family)
MSFIRRCLEIVIGLVFLASGSSKLNTGFEFLHTVSGYEMLGWHATIIVAAGLPWLELTLGAVLIVGLASEAALWLSTILTIVFVIACTSAWHRNLSIPCGCFGSSEIISGATVLRSWSILALTATALALSLTTRGRRWIPPIPA